PSPKFHAKVRGPPFGSNDPLTFNSIGTFTKPWYGPPASATGSLHTGLTVIVNDLLSLRGGEPLFVTVTVAPYTPASENPGARWMFPVVAPVVVTVMNKGPLSFEKVRGVPQGLV